jgi:hypothetical protein
VVQFVWVHVSIPHTGNGLIAMHVNDSNNPVGRGVGADLTETAGSGPGALDGRSTATEGGGVGG